MQAKAGSLYLFSAFWQAAEVALNQKSDFTKESVDAGLGQ